MFYTESFQTKYLNSLIQDQCVISVYLKNGICLKGQLIGQTDTAIFLKHGTTQIIYKSQISTISPQLSCMELESAKIFETAYANF